MLSLFLASFPVSLYIYISAELHDRSVVEYPSSGVRSRFHYVVYYIIKVAGIAISANFSFLPTSAICVHEYTELLGSSLLNKTT